MKRSPIWLLVAGLTCAVQAEESEITSPDINPDDPASYIKFTEELDNKCMQRAPRGKRLYVASTHPEKIIKYRFIRVFANKRQPGINAGILEPGAEPTALGCTVIDGRDQYWQIMRALYAEPTSEAATIVKLKP